MSKTVPPPPIENMPFASELIKARSELGLTQSQLSAESHVSLSAIKGYETGRNLPGARELRELCRALQTTPNKLLFGTETPFAPFESKDLAAEPTERGLAVQRGRIVLLANLLSFDESFAIYRLMHSIALARHGEDVVSETLSGADLMTAIEAVSAGKPVDMDLLPKNEEFLRSMATALRTALEASQDGKEISPITVKVPKK